MACNVISLKSWANVSFSQKALLKRLMKITFLKRVVWSQTVVSNSCLSKNYLAI